MLMLRFSLLVGLILAGTAEAKILNLKKVVKSKRYLELIGVVDGSAIGLASKIHNLTEKSSKPIWMLINSPGGAVLPGTSVLDAMHAAKKRGVEFRCVSGTLAASMAFVILSACDKRYVLNNTKLLFHPMSLSVRRARVSELYPSIKMMVGEEQELMILQPEAMGMDNEPFLDHYFAETFWTGSNLRENTSGFLTVVDGVSGPKNLFKWRRQRFWFGKGRLKNSENLPAGVLEIIRRFYTE